MPDFGFPAQPRQQSLSDMIALLRKRSDTARIESVTGRSADAAAKLSGQIGSVMQIEKSIRDLQNYGEAIALSEVRASATQTSLDRIVTASQDLADAATIYLTSGSLQNGVTLATQGLSALSDITSALNVSISGRALFAGDDATSGAIIDADTIMTQIVPLIEAAPDSATALAAVDQAFNTAGGLFDTAFYQGGAGDAPQTEIAVGVTVDYAMRADDSALREVLSGVVAVAAAIDPSTNVSDTMRDTLFSSAVTVLRSSIAGVIGLQGELGVSEQRIATVKARNIANEASLTLTYNELTGVDQYESVLRLTGLEDQLETAFATTARLSNLSLTNYI